MKELDERQKAFIDLWKSGHRFLTEEDMKNRNHGMYKEEAGFYEGMTIEGMKYLARKGDLTVEGLKFTEEELEIFFSVIKFMRQFK